MIAAEHLVKNYGRKPVLCDMSLSANAGKITLLVGSKRCWKDDDRQSAGRARYAP